MATNQLTVLDDNDGLPERKPAAPATVLDIIAQAARDPQVDVAKLSALLELKERIDAKQAEIEFTRDFASASSEMPRILKHGVIDMGSKGQIPFARYEDLDRIIRPIELKYGFTRSFLSEPREEAGILLTMVLSHRGGHSVRSTRWMPPDPGPGRNGMQAIGSAGSYAKRYLTIDGWNIVCEGIDNDSMAAYPLTAEQLNNVRSMVDACELKGDALAAFLRFADARSLEAIQQRDYERVMEALRKKLSKLQEAGQ